jgi:23S rRNA (pseudouridine1915-N3)-methyltransferase
VKLAFVFVGGHKEEWLGEISDEYSKKLGYFFPTEIIRLKPSRQARASADVKQADETADILKQIKKDDLVILCDEKGQSLDSKAFSAKFVKLIERGRPRIVFVIGGAFGFGADLRARADMMWSLSPLTFNHHVAQAVVLEQCYRAFAIWKNLPYHNE